MKKFTKEHFLIYGMIVILLGLAFILWEKFVDGHLVKPPMIFSNQLELPVEQEFYYPGDTVYVAMSFCKYRELTGTIQWNLIDGSLILFPPKQGSVNVGCHKNLRVEVEKIPEYIPAGEVMHFEANLSYDINNINKVNIPLRTTTFTIREKNEN